MITAAVESETMDVDEQPAVEQPAVEQPEAVAAEPVAVEKAEVEETATVEKAEAVETEAPTAETVAPAEEEKDWFEAAREEAAKKEKVERGEEKKEGETDGEIVTVEDDGKDFIAPNEVDEGAPFNLTTSYLKVLGLG